PPFTICQMRKQRTGFTHDFQVVLFFFDFEARRMWGRLMPRQYLLHRTILSICYNRAHSLAFFGSKRNWIALWPTSRSFCIDGMTEATTRKMSYLPPCFPTCATLHAASCKANVKSTRCKLRI